MTVGIQINAIRAFGCHGLSDEERARPQPFEVDLEVWLLDDSAVTSDDIDDTVDYDSMASIAVDVVEGSQCKLLEHLAGSIGTRILEQHAALVKSVSVTVRKLHPPMAYHLGSVGVCVEQQLAASAGQ